MRSHEAAHGATVHTFESAEELVNATPSDRLRKQWDGHDIRESQAQVRTWARQGDTTLVPRAEALMDKIMLNVNSERSEWGNDIVGAYADVPVWLAGRPDAMRRRKHMSDDRAPLKIVINLTSSAAIPNATLETRGCALLALAMVLTADRPVDLSACIFLGGKVSMLTFPIPTRPLDLAYACALLTSNGLTRGFGYAYLFSSNPGVNGSWPWHCVGSDPVLTERTRAALDLAEGDIYIPPVSLYEKWHDPVAWVQARLAEIQGKAE